MAGPVQVTQPDRASREALVTFGDGSRAMVSAGISSGRTDSYSGLEMRYTYGPHAGSTVNLSFGFDQNRRPADGAITPTVTGNHPSARQYAEHAAAVLRNPNFHAITSMGTYNLAASGNALATQIESTYGITPARNAPQQAPRAP